MTKEGIGTKGPTLTTYLSIPGRYLVMMPGMSRLGVSRKIEDEEARDKARELLAGAQACRRTWASSSAPPGWTAPSATSSAT